MSTRPSCQKCGSSNIRTGVYFPAEQRAIRAGGQRYVDGTPPYVEAWCQEPGCTPRRQVIEVSYDRRP